MSSRERGGSDVKVVSESLGVPSQTQADFVVLHTGGGKDVEHWIDAAFIGEIDDSLLDQIRAVAEIELSSGFEENIPEQARLLNRSAQFQIG